MNQKKAIIIAAAIILVAIVACFTVPDLLDSKEKMISEVIIEVSKQFKSPSSVRVISGKGKVYRKDGWLGGDLHLMLSGQNGYGADVSDSYIISLLPEKDGKLYILSKEIQAELYSKYQSDFYRTDDFSVEKVNRLLKQYWGN